MPAASAYRTNAAEKRLTRSLVFDQLPMAVQDRLTRSLAEGGAPRPLLSVVRGTRPPSARRWAYVAVAALCADLAAWVIGYGDRLNEPVLSPAGLSLLHAVALSVGVFAALRAARIRRRYLGISYPTGRHLFDLDLVEVDGREIRVTALDTLKSVEPRDVAGSPKIAVVFEDGHEVLFDAGGDAEAECVGAQKAIDEGRHIARDRNLERLDRVDPFLELRIGDDWQAADAASTGAKGGALSFAERLPSWGVVAAALAAGALLGAVTLWAGQRHLGAVDDARFEAARGNDALLEKYVARGGKHVAAAEDELFELRKDNDGHLAKYIELGGERGEIAARIRFERQLRLEDDIGLGKQVTEGTKYADQADEALFKILQQRGTVGAFEQYLESGKKHVAEVNDTLLPDLLLAEALKKQQIKLLKDLIKRYPRSRQAEKARDKMYDVALKHYMSRGQPAPPALRFINAMLASMRSRDDTAIVLHVTTAKVSRAKLRAAEQILSGLGKGVYGVFEWWFKEAFPADFLEVASSEASGDERRPRVAVTVAPQVSGELVSEDGDVITNLVFRMTFHATVPGSQEQVGWSATTKAIDQMIVQVTEDPYDPDKTRKRSQDEAYRRMLDSLDTVIRVEMSRRL
ncbi:MAG: hypothetical protein R3B70_30450 [Polyangiaceae bacterium]